MRGSAFGIVRGFALALVGLTASAGCSGPPPHLVIAPTVIDITGRFGDSATAPPASVTLRLTSDRADQSVGWKVSGATSWCAVSEAEGGTPADLKLTLRHEALRFGRNEATLKFETSQGPADVRVRFTALASLIVGPVKSLGLEGNVGEPKSGKGQLEITSPGKDGLPWSCVTDDPWLVIEPTQGKTPARVFVHADLSRVTDSLSGKVTFRADST